MTFFNVSLIGLQGVPVPMGTATKVIKNKRHKQQMSKATKHDKRQTSLGTNVINDKCHYDTVAYDVCHLCQIFTFVAYDVYRIIWLSLMTFVTL